MLRGSSEYQERVLAIAGTVLLLCIALIAAFLVANPFGTRPDDRFSISIDTPYVGQGVEPGTAVVLHGVKVGQVTTVTNSSGGGVRLVTDLQKQPMKGITNTLNIDFRPINYFGVPGINLVPNPGGQALRDGAEISLVPKGNFTLSELLSQLGNVSEASLTPQLIEVIDRVTRYTDGLNPLFETAVTVTRTVADVQTVPTEQLLANTSSVASAFPGFSDAAVESLRRISDYSYYPGASLPPAETIGLAPHFPYLEGVKVENLAEQSESYFQNGQFAFLKVASDGLFGSVGKLLYSHVDDLFPLISGIKALTDVTPPLLRPEDIAAKLAELRSRFEKLYAGNGDQRAISVRVVLDSLPGVAAPLGIAVGDPK